jgi:hypothetical protein
MYLVLKTNAQYNDLNGAYTACAVLDVDLRLVDRWEDYLAQHQAVKTLLGHEVTLSWPAWDLSVFQEEPDVVPYEDRWDDGAGWCLCATPPFPAPVAREGDVDDDEGGRLDAPVDLYSCVLHVSDQGVQWVIGAEEAPGPEETVLLTKDDIADIQRALVGAEATKRQGATPCP